jgi:hypothetical protein
LPGDDPELIKEVASAVDPSVQEKWRSLGTPILDGKAVTQVYSGVYSYPNGYLTPQDPTKAAIYYQNRARNEWHWDVTGQRWNQTQKPPTWDEVKIEGLV